MRLSRGPFPTLKRILNFVKSKFHKIIVNCHFLVITTNSLSAMSLTNFQKMSSIVHVSCDVLLIAAVFGKMFQNPFSIFRSRLTVFGIKENILLISSQTTISDDQSIVFIENYMHSVQHSHTFFFTKFYSSIKLESVYARKKRK